MRRKVQKTSIGNGSKTEKTNNDNNEAIGSGGDKMKHNKIMT